MLKYIMRENGRKKKVLKKLCINFFFVMSFFFIIYFMNFIYFNYKIKYFLYFYYIFVKNMLKYFIFIDIFLLEWYMMLKLCI